MQEQANGEEDSSEGEPNCWYVAPDDGFEYEEHSSDLSEDEEPWCGSGTMPLTGDYLSDSDDPHESMPVPSNDDHGETLEQLNTQCPWNMSEEPESDWSSSDQDEFTLPMQPEEDKEDSVREGTKHHDKRLQRQFIKELQRGAENNWQVEGLRTSKVLHALHDWAQMHRRKNVGWKHWAHRHKQEALANIRENYDQRLYEATITAKVKNRLAGNTLHNWTQMHRWRNLGGRHWNHKQMREAMTAIRNNHPDARRTKDAESTKAVRIREAIVAVNRRRKKLARFTLRKIIVITANETIKAMNAVFWAEARGRTRQLRRSREKANNTRERRANPAIDAAAHARGTTTAKQVALKTWRDWHRRTESLNSWMGCADWMAWEARARQKIFYDWQMNSGLRAEDYAWKGWPADGMSPETKRKWTEELIAGGIKHEYILLHWASTWHKRWSDASIKRRREALNTWRIKNSLRRRVSMWSNLWNDGDDEQGPDGSIGEDNDDKGGGTDAPTTGATGPSGRQRWTDTGMSKAAEWHATLQMRRTPGRLRLWRYERKRTRSKIERRTQKWRRREQREQDAETDQRNEMHAGKVRQMIAKTANNGAKTVEWITNEQWEETMRRMEAALIPKLPQMM